MTFHRISILSTLFSIPAIHKITIYSLFDYLWAFPSFHTYVEGKPIFISFWIIIFPFIQMNPELVKIQILYNFLKVQLWMTWRQLKYKLLELNTNYILHDSIKQTTLFQIGGNTNHTFHWMCIILPQRIFTFDY